MQNRVLVMATDKTPLMPCHPARARELMRKGKAAGFRQYPFTIILKQTTTAECQPLTVKIDPGSKTTGIAVVADYQKGKRLIWAAELSHRGLAIKASLESRRSLRRNRRARKTRYRKPRFLNRTRPKGWLAPSIESRVLNVQTWVSRISRFAPVTSLSVEVVKFDMQLIGTPTRDNPEISGVEYKQGSLCGFEVREYLLEKWGRTCAYCDKKDVPLQIEHIIPKSRGGTNRVQNLTLACQKCNQKKGARTADEFGYPKLMGKAKATLRDAAAVNTTRKELAKRLRLTGLPVETGSGGLTKFNRTQQGYPKAHFIDAACVGQSGASVFLSDKHTPLLITAAGHGSRQMCRTDKYGFPNRHRPRAKSYMGFQTGDIVKANVPTGKYAGGHSGRVAIRHRPKFVVVTSTGLRVDTHPKYLKRTHRQDGYAYSHH